MSVVAVAAIGTVLSAVGTFIQAKQQRKAAKEAQRARERQFEAEQEARNVQTAQSKAQQAIERRRAERERRIKIAQIQQGAENAGISGASGETGAVGVIGTNTAAVIANSASRNKAVEGINASLNRGARAGVDAANALNQGPSLFATAVGVAGDIFSASGGFDIFDTSPSVPKTKDLSRVRGTSAR